MSLMLVVSNAEPSSGGRSERSRWTITALKDTPGISPDFKEPAMTCPIDPKPTKPIDRDSTRRLLFSCPVDIARKDRGQVDHNQLRWTKRAASILNHSQNYIYVLKPKQFRRRSPSSKVSCPHDHRVRHCNY